MKCPRRDELGAGAASVFKLPDEDDWRPNGTCSYCGSMAPEAFLAKAKAGDELGPTDKNYKVYVGGRGKFYFQHLSAEQRQEFVDLLNARTMNIGYPGRFYVLPFFAVPR